MAWLATNVPHAAAVEIFQRIGYETIPPTSLWEQTQAVGRVWQAQQAEARHPTDPTAAQTWAQARREALYLGQVEKITQPLEHAHLLEQARYFHTHTRRMQYQEFREQHYPIGSGTVESGTPAPRLPALSVGAGVKQFKHRLPGPGMRWSRPGLEPRSVLLLRAAVLSHTFDDAWAAACN